MTREAIELVCCYADTDEVWLHKLETHLRLLQRQKLISLWHAQLITPGIDWVKAIESHLETASVILLLVSADFLASDFCYNVAMAQALARQEAGEAYVLPILVHPVDWHDAPFAHLQPLPTNARPLSTWEHQELALANIATSIRRLLQEAPGSPATLLAGMKPLLWNLPYPRNPLFLGRDAELAQMRSSLRAGEVTALTQIQAISGLGGIGKTQLALEYAYRYRRDYHTIFWARAESTEALVSSYIALAALLKLPEREAREQDVTVQALKIWLQTHQKWLLILDNADELSLLPAFLPPNLGGHVLLTTRAAATGRFAQRLEIAILSPEHGALLLLRRAALISSETTLEQVSQEVRELALRMSCELGGLPLALDQAGAYLEETGTSLSSYWQLYQQYRAELLHHRGGVVTDHPAPVATTWLLSFRRAEEKHPAAADLLRLCAFLSPDAIPEEVLTVGTSFLGPTLAPMAMNAFQLNQAIEALRAYSLIGRDSKEKTLSLHRLVQAVLQDTLEEQQKRLWAERAILVVNAAFPQIEHGTEAGCERLLSQALRATQMIEQYQIHSAEAGRLLYETASYLKERGHYLLAESLILQALHIFEQQFGPEHPAAGDALNRLASLYREQGKFVQAEPLYLRALHIFEQQFGPEHPAAARVLSGLVRLYRQHGKDAQAEPLCQRALHIWKQQPGPEHLEMTYPLNSLGSICRRQGKYADAEAFLKQALHIWEQQPGPEHPNMAYPLTNLATLYREQGKYTEAEHLYQHALRIRESQLGPEHPYLAYPLSGLAALYHEQGKDSQAEPFFQRALHIWEQAQLPEHPAIADIMDDFAKLREAQGKINEAALLYARALAIRKQALGAQHLKTVEAYQHLSTLLHTQGNQLEAFSSPKDLLSP